MGPQAQGNIDSRLTDTTRRMDDELDRFKKGINLIALATSFGYGLDPPNASSGASSVAMKHPVTGDKIVIRHDCDGYWKYFSVRHDRDNGDVLNFLQWRRRFSLGRARQELRTWLATGARTPGYPPVPELKPARPVDRREVALRYTAARSTPLPGYLATRGLLGRTLADRRFRGTFRVDRWENVLFPHLADGAVVGFEIKGPRYTGFAAGGMKTAWSSHAFLEDRRLVIVEGSIDALSYHQLQPDSEARYLSTSGSPGRRQLEMIRREIARLPAGAAVILATDADEEGDRLADRLAQLTDGRSAQRVRPVGVKDWNDLVRRQDKKSAATEKQLRPADRQEG